MNKISLNQSIYFCSYSECQYTVKSVFGIGAIRGWWDGENIFCLFSLCEFCDIRNELNCTHHRNSIENFVLTKKFNKVDCHGMVDGLMDIYTLYCTLKNITCKNGSHVHILRTFSFRSPISFSAFPGHRFIFLYPLCKNGKFYIRKIWSRHITTVIVLFLKWK